MQTAWILIAQSPDFVTSAVIHRMLNSPRRGQAMGKNVTMWITKPSNFVFGSLLIVVVVMVYWGGFVVNRATANSTLASAFGWSPATQLKEFPAYSTSSLANLSTGKLPVESPLRIPIKSLIDALRKAVTTVEKLTGVSADRDIDLNLWRLQNPCKSRTELSSFYSRISYSPNRKTPGRSETKQWGTVLFEYARLHRVCTRAAGNLTEYFFERNTSTGCKFMIADAKNGMGNKLFIMAPALVYAVLTQRVFLISESTGVPDLMCEPFPGSSWRLSEDIVSYSVPIWNETREFMGDVDRAKREHESTIPMYASRIDDNWQPNSRFFCDVEQSYFRQVPWLTIHGCLYFLPKLFAIPSIRKTLEALFPDPTLALTQILRANFLPRDQTWARVSTVKKYFDSAHTQTGIQARYFNNSATKHKILNANVESCLLENNLLEQAIPAQEKDHETTIFIASLTPDLQEHLRGVYNRSTTSLPTSLNFVQLSNEIEQRFGAEAYDQALVEVLRLSFSHTLLLSPQSTFGGLAQAYGALTPWIVESRDEVLTPCERAQSVDNCYQIPELEYKCRYDGADSKLGRAIAGAVNYIKPCLAIDTHHRSGLQLVAIP